MLLFLKQYRHLRVKHLFLIVFSIILCMQFLIFNNFNYKVLTTPTPPFANLHKLESERIQSNTIHKNVSNFTLMYIPSEAEYRMSLIRKKIKKLTMHSQRMEITKFLSQVESLKKPSNRVHAFYYVYYGNPDIDKEWKYWIPEGGFSNEMESAKSYKNLNYHPPEDISSNFYPAIGCYSSREYRIINIHFKQLQDAGIGVLAITWHLSKSEEYLKDILTTILDLANKYQLKITLHLVNDVEQNPYILLRRIHHITTTYSIHPAFYKLEKNGKHLPLYYVYERYNSPTLSWKNLLSSEGNHSIRGTPYDGIFIGLLRDKQHRYEIEKSHFDGFYTYFASNGLSYGSSWKNWKMLGTFAKKHNLLFFPTVSPGYTDTRVNPWRTSAVRHRSRGHYYQIAWRAALSAEPSGVTINSFNNWRDGSQIEPAAPKTTPQFTYLDYQPEGPMFYLNLTRYWIKQLESK